MLRVLPIGRFICEQIAIYLSAKFGERLSRTKHVYRSNPNGSLAPIRYGDNAFLPRDIFEYVGEGRLHLLIIYY